jgi:hypothetical protein
MTVIRIEDHLNFGWRPKPELHLVKNLAFAPLAVEEIPTVAQAMPVAFVKTHNRWHAVAVMGPVHGTNVFISHDGKWRAHYIPAIIRAQPFKLNEEGSLAIWEGYKPEPKAMDGVQAFFHNGELHPHLQQTHRFLRLLHNNIAVAHETLSELESKSLLEAWDGLDAYGKNIPDRTLQGLFTVKSNRFHDLGDNTVLNLFRTKALRWLYAQGDSLNHATRFRTLARSLLEATPNDAISKRNDAENSGLVSAVMDDLGDIEI